MCNDLSAMNSTANFAPQPFLESELFNLFNAFWYGAEFRLNVPGRFFHFSMRTNNLQGMNVYVH